MTAGGEGELFPQALRDLLAAHGPSGHESAAAAVWRAAAEAWGAEVQTDLVGSVSARWPSGGGEAGGVGGAEMGAVGAGRSAAGGGELGGARSGHRKRSKGGERSLAAPAVQSTAAASAPTAAGEVRRLLVMGHIDEIGLIVTHIDDDGFLWFAEVGGWDAQVLVGQRLRIATREGPLPGVVGRKPIHLLRDEDRKKVAEIRDLHIDIGARDGDHAAELVRVGDVAVIDAEPLELPGGRLAARALDNRIGSFVALRAAQLVAQAGGVDGWEVIAVGAVQEETTFGGSRTSAFALAPHAAIVVDGTHATDAPGIEAKETGRHPLESGPVLSRGSTLHPALFELLHDAAESEAIPFTVEAAGRSTGTDADAVHLSREGVPTALVSIPMRYMHSPVELVALSDVHACARLIAAAACRLDRETSFAR
ncbi:MAG TPA: M42 family peptidase [Solirubrobacteraceae bacterium]|nr:M42 family peptidase [Solirubrobacteraceae bacterium]